MSRWCHVSASIFGDSIFWGTHEELTKKVQTALANAPKIKGSEGDLDIYVNAISGYTLIGSNKQLQNQVVITLAGDLRDTDYEQVTKELNEFLEFTKQCIFCGSLGVRSCGAIINDEFVNHPIILWTDKSFMGS